MAEAARKDYSGRQDAQPVQALPVVAFRPVRPTVHMLEHADCAVEHLPLLIRLYQDKAALAPLVMRADVDYEAMPVVGKLRIKQHRFLALQSE